MEFALPTFLIALREGVEAALVVGIVMAYLQKLERTYLYIWVFAGVVGGILISGGVGLAFNWLLQSFDTPEVAPIFKPLLEGSFTLVAIAMLSWMLVWMTQQSKLIKGEVESALNQSLGQRGEQWGIFSLILFAVLREGFEVVIFITAKFQEGALPILGAITGLISSVLIGVCLFQFGIKINIGNFFRVMGVLLILIVSGLVISTLGHFDTVFRLLSQSESLSLCWASPNSCILGGLVWNLSTVLPQRQFPGIVLRALFGYTDRLYLVQAIAYLGFLVGIGTIYWQILTNTRLFSIKNSSKNT
ncbi:high-affinity Fe2+/Pb2+ permease [Synechococcus sp. PCC 7502]|uniref:FTR1 family iron permease n=1 Tax=Synechococcus sp. PCC 7502 TaxID=1173263 RepID=UPI00029FFE79|nr:FTR1 family protein [Synechococcus sp. PCC 7502]AFY74119.1 high-affinity Fe2+/Pb2+ permease [Synechococcus sp. PCC 7502]